METHTSKGETAWVKLPDNGSYVSGIIMAEKRMHCWNCPRYSRTERSCADGKANPKKKADSVTVAEVLGLRALCHYNPYRDALAARMYFPHTRLGIHSVPPRRPRRGKYGDLTLPEAGEEEKKRRKEAEETGNRRDKG